MAGNDELFQSLQMLQSGVQQYAQSVRALQANRSIQAANDAVNTIRLGEGDEFAKRQQVQQVAQNLTSSLIQNNVPIERVEAAAGAVAGPKPQLVQSLDQGLLSDDPSIRARAQVVQSQNQQFKLDQIDATTGAKQQGKDQQALTKSMEFFRTKVAKDNLESLDKFAPIEDLIKTGNNLGANQALKTLLKVNDQRISDADFKTALPNTSSQLAAKRWYDASIKNQPLPEDNEAILSVAKVLQSKLKERVTQKAQAYASSRSAVLNGVTPEYLSNLLIQDALPGYGAPSAAAVTSGAAPAPAIPDSTGLSKYFTPIGK